jgi:hypothetical protein
MEKRGDDGVNACSFRHDEDESRKTKSPTPNTSLLNAHEQEDKDGEHGRTFSA